MSKVIEGAEDMLAIARGEKPAAAITVNGHHYVPAADPSHALADGIRDHYVAASRAAQQVGKLKAMGER